MIQWLLHTCCICFLTIIKVAYEDLLYESLTEDGYEVEGRSEVDIRTVIGATGGGLVKSKWLQHHPPMLKLLCHQAIHHYRHQLAFYTEVLPAALVTSITDFLVLKDTIDHYDSWN